MEFRHLQQIAAVCRHGGFSAAARHIQRRCDIQAFDLTAHANRDDLLKFVDQVNPKTVILGHGDPAAKAWFAAEIQKAHPRIKIFQPGPGETVDCGPAPKTALSP